MTKLNYTIFNLVSLSLIIYFGVDLFYKAVRSQFDQVQTEMLEDPAPFRIERHKKPPFGNFLIITERNLFGSADKASDVSNEEYTEDLPPTSLNLRLLGTVAGPEENARAVIMDIGVRKQGLYKTGDSIQDALVKRILRTKVVLRVGEKDEMLIMEEPSSTRSTRGRMRRGQLDRFLDRPGMTPRSSRTITVDRSAIQAALENINELLSQARIQPHIRDGYADGLSVSRIQRNSIFSKLGLRNGDVIQEINGNELDSPEDIFSLYESLKSGSGASVTIQRRGRQQNLNYRFR